VCFDAHRRRVGVEAEVELRPGGRRRERGARRDDRQPDRKTVPSSAARPRIGSPGMFRSNLLWIVYLIVGVIVAADDNYLEHVNKLVEILEAGLAVVLWPLLLFGVDINLS
jgi:hypothetical protein